MINELEELKKENENLRNKIDNEYVNRKDITKTIISELVRLKILKPNADPFGSTKKLLENFNKLDSSIDHLNSEIKKLEASKNEWDGPRFKSTSIVQNVSPSLKTLDIIDNRISDLKQTIKKISCYQSQIRAIINTLPATDRKLIEDFYFKKIDVVDISIELGCDQSTTYRKVNKVLDKIKIELFPSKFIDSLL